MHRTEFSTKCHCSTCLPHRQPLQGHRAECTDLRKRLSLLVWQWNHCRSWLFSTMEIDAFTDLVTLAVVVFTHAAHKNECKKRLSQCQCKKKLLTKALRRCQMSLLVFVAATWCSLNLWWDQPRVWPSSVAWCLVFFAFAINLWPCCCCWLLLNSAILHSWADSVHLHVVLHEWIAFYSVFLNIHQSGVLTALAWLVPHETAAISVRSVYTIQPCTVSLHAKPHT